MDVVLARPADHSPVEPPGMTLTDLCVLVIASSLMFTIGWRGMGPVLSLPHPNLWLAALTEIMEKVGLALFLVVIIRRARYGGLSSPAEFLLIVCGAPILPDLLAGLPTRIQSYLYDETTVWPDPLAFAPKMLGYAIWRWTELTVSVVLPSFLSLVLVAGRRHLQGWAKTVLLAATFLFLSFGTIQLFFEAGEWLIRVANQAVLGEKLSWNLGFLIYAFPCFVLYSLPAAATLLDRRGNPYPGWTWLEWLGVILALLWLLTHLTDLHIQAISEIARDLWIWSSVVLFDGLIVASALLSLWLVSRLTPFWNRCLGLGYDRESQSPAA